MLISSSFFVKDIIPLAPDLPNAAGFELGEMQPIIQSLDIDVLPTKYQILGHDVATADPATDASLVEISLINAKVEKGELLAISMQVLLY